MTTPKDKSHHGISAAQSTHDHRRGASVAEVREEEEPTGESNPARRLQGQITQRHLRSTVQRLTTDAGLLGASLSRRKPETGLLYLYVVTDPGER